MVNKLKDARWVSEFLNIKLARVYELTREKKIPFVQIGERQYRYSETALMQWIENGGNQTNENGIFENA